jgi:hypothetical protein
MAFTKNSKKWPRFRNIYKMRMMDTSETEPSVKGRNTHESARRLAGLRASAMRAVIRTVHVFGITWMWTSGAGRMLVAAGKE